MKYLLIVFLFIACDKNEDSKAKCYECEIAAFNGSPGYNRDVCTDRIDTVHFRNAQGQSLASQCTPK